MYPYESFCFHFKRAAHEVAQLDRNPRLATTMVSRSAWERWFEGDIQSTPRANTCRILEHLLGEPADVLFGPPLPTQQREDQARTQSPHLDAMTTFRLADRQLGGGHVYSSLVIYLRTEVATTLIGLGTAQGTEAFRDAAVLTEMAGWMAYDSGRDSVAQGHLLSALNFGQAVADATVAANVEASMSHLALQGGYADQAVELARSGLGRLRGIEAVPVLASRLHAMKARALARLGYAKQAQQSLDSAREELAAADTVYVPNWVAPFDDAALASEAASTLLELRVFPAALEEANRALELRDASRARSRGLGQITLAKTLIAQGQVEAACAVTDDLLETCQSLGSIRISRELADLQVSLEPYASSRPVKETIDRMTGVARHRRLLLASLTAPEGSQRE
ncbi:hypothetical protein AB5J52_48665 (plasmid) [Streptomyces sp. R39]|uniref:XRE family transcriptional regulator n=1 Tax=Streptomyces sp. R39 TaxID=3238631 RepID=A0AB39R6Q8_9ACTN